MRRALLSLLTITLLAGCEGSSAPDEPANAAPPPAAEMRNVTSDPATLDFGTLPTAEVTTITMKLTNENESPLRLLEANSSCGCTTLEFPKGKTLAPGESIEVPVEFKAAVKTQRVRKGVTIIASGVEPAIISVIANVVSYVQMNPDPLGPAKDADGRFTVESVDSEAFSILEILPPVAEIPEGAATVHELRIDWDEWRRLGQRAKLVIRTDHPLCPRVYGDIDKRK